MMSRIARDAQRPHTRLSFADLFKTRRFASNIRDIGADTLLGLHITSGVSRRFARRHFGGARAGRDYRSFALVSLPARIYQAHVR